MIYSGVGFGPNVVGTSDATVLNPAAGNSFEMYAGVLHNTGATVVTVELFLSDDGTSAAGERVFVYALSAGETKRIPPITVMPTEFLLSKADVTGASIYGTYTRRTGADVGLA